MRVKGLRSRSVATRPAWAEQPKVPGGTAFFTVHNLTLRALPAVSGAWNSIWKRFWRRSRPSVIGAFFQLLAEVSKTAHLVQMLATVVRAHVSAASAKAGS